MKRGAKDGKGQTPPNPLPVVEGAGSVARWVQHVSLQNPSKKGFILAWRVRGEPGVVWEVKGRGWSCKAQGGSPGSSACKCPAAGLEEGQGGVGHHSPKM